MYELGLHEIFSSHDDYPWMATIIGIIVTIAVIVVAYAKKRKIKEKHKDEEEK